MIFRALIAVVLLAPLLLGAVDTWAWGALGCAVAVLLAAWSIRTLLRRDALAVPLSRIWPFAVPFALAVVWVAVQMSPWVPQQWQHPLWHSAARALGRDVAAAVSVAPHDTGSALARLLTYAAIFWLTLQYCRDRGRARLAIVAVSLAGFGYAAYGLIEEFTGTDTILWLDKTAYVGVVTSTFINRNTYATYAGLGLVCATALLIHLLARAAAAGQGLRQGLLQLLEGGIARGWWLLAAWLVLAAALLLTQSRGGLMAAGVGHFGILVAAVATRRTTLRQAVIIGLPIVITAIGFVAFSGERTAERLAATNISTEARLLVYERTIDAIASAPLLGTGYGSFADVFRGHRSEAIGEIFETAHNTYLELALELGLPAAALLILSIAILFARCLVGVRLRRRDSIFPLVGLGATLLVATHSLVDFSLQIPAVAATYALIMGVAVAQSWRSDQIL